MLDLLFISIGIVLVIEGLLYFLLADKIYHLLNLLKNINTKQIKTVSLCVALLGFCLIYFTFRLYKN